MSQPEAAAVETIDRYKARILSNTEGKDPLEVQRQTSSLLSSLMKGRDADSLRRNPQSGKWSVAQIVTHLAESEVVAFWRYRQMLESSGGNILPYDQDVWEKMGDYAHADPHASLELFRLLRERNLQLLDRLTPEQWEMYGIHAERGKESVRHLVRMMAGHDVNHLEQIRKILEG
ncbi:MAG: yfiT 2 [Acidobacteriaceae bacterium]|nr:yfiT 2 [Acidobacteriaceae bacterium]